MDYTAERRDARTGNRSEGSRRALRVLVQTVALAEPLQRELAARYHVSVGDLFALSRLRHLGEATTTAFGAACGLRRSATTDLVDRLESAGLVGRFAHPSDRRARLIRLTAAGREALGGADLVGDSAIAGGLGRLSLADQDQLAELLERLLERAAEEEPGGEVVRT